MPAIASAAVAIGVAADVSEAAVDDGATVAATTDGAAGTTVGAAGARACVAHADADSTNAIATPNPTFLLEFIHPLLKTGRRSLPCSLGQYFHPLW